MHIRDKKGKLILIDCIDYELVAGYTWYVSGNGYAATGTPRYIMMHRLLLGAVKGQCVDHINGNPLDNRRCNLRFVTAHQNSYNSRSRVGRTLPRGVVRMGNRYIARIRADGKEHYLGCYADAEAAGIAYQVASKTFHGEFARESA